MQPSGEVGRFEVVNLPSPPADRKRYPTGRPSSYRKSSLCMPNPYESPTEASSLRHVSGRGFLYKVLNASTFICRNPIGRQATIMVLAVFTALPYFTLLRMRDFDDLRTCSEITSAIL
ncbi:hypothetical protein FHS27_006565 [Rhodopirellula rubra]|uniref:Uncharacterized protein n=1 Tax=Aporhodopirellula rubra TaxID=980271 RepID=A0A7W5E6I8_9BACT|nr:hypothetical protein [Aporhodopirellula rubra]